MHRLLRYGALLCLITSTDARAQARAQTRAQAHAQSRAHAQTPPHARVPLYAQAPVQPPAQPKAIASIPEWARTRWETLAQIRTIQLSSHMKPQVLTGDFDGDSMPDVAILVEHRTSHKIGIALLHRKGAVSRVIGAGREFGNGGDNFDWADAWKIEARTRARATDAIIIERESSASALIYFAKGMYHWKQLGD